jgi:hypothetical protein
LVDPQNGTIEMTTHVVGELKVPSGRLCVGDPFTTSFESERPLARTVPTGRFPVELAIARFGNGDLRVACARVRFVSSRELAHSWEPAGFEGDRAVSEEEVSGYGVDAGMGCFFDHRAQGSVTDVTRNAWLRAAEANEVESWTWHTTDLGEANVVMFSSGWGDGFYGSFWGFAADGRTVELVTDFELLVGPTSDSFELSLPLPRGRIKHPLLERYDVTLEAPWLSRRTVILGGKGSARVELTDGTPVTMQYKLDERHYTWESASPNARLRVLVMTGVEQFQVV